MILITQFSSFTHIFFVVTFYIIIDRDKDFREKEREMFKKTTKQHKKRKTYERGSTRYNDGTTTSWEETSTGKRH